jgi:hypothetical protein
VVGETPKNNPLKISTKELWLRRKLWKEKLGFAKGHVHNCKSYERVECCCEKNGSQR